MLAIEEKESCVVLLKPDVLLQDKEDAVVSLFESNNLHVKKRKQVYLTRPDAEAFYSSLKGKSSLFQAEVESVLRGPCEVLHVEHAETPTVTAVKAFIEQELKWFDDTAAVGEGPPFEKKDIYFSGDTWTALRDHDFFFPFVQSQSTERTLLIVKPHAIERGIVDSIVDDIVRLGLFAYGKRQVQITKDQAEKICADADDVPGSVASLMSDTCPPMVMVVEGPGAVDRLKLLVGPMNAGFARDAAPTSIRARHGTDSTNNVVHCSGSAAAAKAELAMMYPKGSLTMQRTMCIVQPEALDQLVSIIAQVESSGFTILRQQQTTLSVVRAEEFLRDQAASTSFRAVCRYFSSAPICMLCLYRLEAVEVLKQLMGPADPRIAKTDFPLCLRAIYGKDKRRNGLYASESFADGNREVSFFFPEMGQPVPSSEEVTDYLFQKGSQASMDKINISKPDPAGIQIEHTLQQFISRGLMALCQQNPLPKGLEARRWLSKWMEENNPNAPVVLEPDTIEYAEAINAFTETMMTEDGIMNIEIPSSAGPPKQVIEVNVEDEVEDEKIAEFPSPPYVVFVIGGAGSGKRTVCKKLKEDFRMIHLKADDLLQDEVNANTQIGTEIMKYLDQEKPVPDDVTLKLLKNAMLSHLDINRFVLDGFPKSVDQAKKFEQDLAEVAFVLNLDCPEEILKDRIMGTEKKEMAEKILKQLGPSLDASQKVCAYYANIGKLRRVKCAALDSTSSPPAVKAVFTEGEVYAAAKKNFHCRFLYILGPPGAPCMEIAERINEQYGYSCINFSDVLQKYSKSGAKDALRAKASIEKGTALEASIACPLLLEEVWKAQSMGANNFVIVGFPQSIKQMEFLEYRVPGTSRSLLLDFSLSDTVDMDIAFPNMNDDSLEIKDAKIHAFFGEDNQALISKLPDLMRIPCSLSVLNSLVPAKPSLVDKRARLVDTIWKATVPILMPSITVVLGPPCSGAEELSTMLTNLNPNCYGVDVDQLLDKELERKTELGVRMDNMLAKSQAIPLSVNLHLLKGMINQTCSTKAVVENFPNYADQIAYVGKELQIDRVFQIAPTAQALESIKAQFVERSAKKLEAGESSASGDEAVLAFDAIVKKIEPIADHFASQGKLEKLEVNQKASLKDLKGFVDKAMQPQFAVIAGLPHSGSEKFADGVAQKYGCAPAVTAKLLEEWSQDKANMDEPVSRGDAPNALVKVLNKYATRRGSNILVLADFPGTEEESMAFKDTFGEPKVFAHLEVAQQTLLDNAQASVNEDAGEEFNEDAFNEEQDAAGPIRENLQKYWADFECNSKVDGNMPKDDVVSAVCAQLLPRAYVVVGPAGKANLCSKVGAGLACSGKDGKEKRPMKFTILDTNVLCEKGGEHSESIEERLVRESYTVPSGDALPVSLWTELFKEAFAKAPNPLGNFIITNMPTPSAGASGGPSIRDQFNMLEGICSLVGIVVVQCTEDGYFKWCFEAPEEMHEYTETLAKIEEYVEVQYGKDERVTLFKAEVDADEKGDEKTETEEVVGHAFHDAARKVGIRVAQEFFRHRELKMQKLTS